MKARFFKDWFSFSQGERRGIIFLVLLLLILLFMPLLFKFFTRSEPAADMEYLREQAAKLGEAAAPQYDDLADNTAAKSQPAAFTFDPNTISRDSLLLLGFSPKQAAAIITYRERSSGFHSAADFLKLSVITEKQRERLQACVSISPASAKKTSEKGSAEVQKKYEKPQPAVVELNTADTALLRTLPSIGAYFAQKMVEYRDALGGYVSTEQLLEIPNFGQERLQRLSERVTVDVSKVQKFELSEENLDLMRRHPYIGAYAARGIAQFAKRKGHPATLEELSANNVITSSQAHKLRLYVK